MRSAFLATTSDVKDRQYRQIFLDLGIELRRAPTFLTRTVEPQLDPAAAGGDQILVAHPLRQAARFVERLRLLPYLVEDTMLLIDALSSDPSSLLGLPGADTKSWWRNLNSNGLLALLAHVEDRSARFVCQLGAYLGGARYVFAKGELRGRIAHRARVSTAAMNEVPRSNPYFFHEIFEAEGQDLTLAELGGDDFAKVDYRRRAAIELAAQLPFSDHDEQLMLRFPHE